MNRKIEWTIYSQSKRYIFVRKAAKSNIQTYQTYGFGFFCCFGQYIWSLIVIEKAVGIIWTCCITTIFADTSVLSDSKTCHPEESVLFTLIAFFPMSILAFAFLATVSSPSTSVRQPNYMQDIVIRRMVKERQNIKFFGSLYMSIIFLLVFMLLTYSTSPAWRIVN
jgi:hypothetical protein